MFLSVSGHDFVDDRVRLGADFFEQQGSGHGESAVLCGDQRLKAESKVVIVEGGECVVNLYTP